MKTKFFTFAMFVAYLCVASSVKAEPDIIMIELDEIVDSLGHDGDGDGLGGHRGPIAGAVVPTVYYNSGNDELSFETIDEVSFSYYIMDEDDNTLLSGQLSLYENDSTNVYTGNTIYVGNNVTSTKPTGDVNIQNSHIIVRGKQLELHSGTRIDKNFIFQNR